MNEDIEHRPIVLCPGGPMLLRGDYEVRDPDGALHATDRPVSAVCQCGRSATQPWCDGTHQLLNRT